MQLFYSRNIIGDNIELDSDESRHLVKVLRLKIGDETIVIDGKGNQYTCSIQEANPKKAILHILYKVSKADVFGVSIAAAPTKNLSRWEWFLEKSTEIGIDAILPFISSNSERKVLKRERQERILISAMKQSYKANLPELNELSSFSDLITNTFDGKKYIAHCYEDLPIKELKLIHPKGEKALILIGPEGDFSKQEVELAINNGFVAVSLGKSRLRTETAALLACHTIHIINA